jgi:indolepyruvate ferredoxin oxidoreductase, beta subunit
MKRDIILCGVGGQGIVTIATIIGYAAVKRGLFMKQAEVHGMSQRGGDVQSHMRISDRPVFSDLIPEGKVDIIISVEPMEALRYTSFLAPDGWIITNKPPFINTANYPDRETVWQKIEDMPRSILIDADKIARDIANHRASNIVILGAASSHLELSDEELEGSISAIFARKGDAVVQSNLLAYRSGKEFAQQKELSHA